MCFIKQACGVGFKGSKVRFAGASICGFGVLDLVCSRLVYLDLRNLHFRAPYYDVLIRVLKKVGYLGLRYSLGFHVLEFLGADFALWRPPDAKP